MRLTITKTVDKPRYKVIKYVGYTTETHKFTYKISEKTLIKTDDLSEAKRTYMKAKGEDTPSYVKMFELNPATGRYRLLDMRELKGRYIHER